MKKIIDRRQNLKIINQDDGAIIFDKKTGEYFQTNELGKTICEMYNSKLSLDQIAHNISKDYNIPLLQAKNDVENFWDYFIKMR